MEQIYKCPDCGAGMTFDAGSQMLVCSHCGKKQSVEEYEKSNPASEKTTEQEEEKQQELQEFHCPSCGAKLMTDAYTAAAVCGYCGSSVVLEDRLDGKETPDAVLPFSISREQAGDRLRAFAKESPFAPRSFTKSSTLEKVTGMYVPYWMYCCDIKARVQARCTRSRVERRGDTEYIHTDHFQVYRDVEAAYERIPADASLKMPDDVMEKLEPYMYSGLKEFEPAYLSGFTAEKFNITSDKQQDRVKERAEEYALSLAMESISGYSSVQILNKDVDLELKKTEYALLPVWILNYRYLGKDYQFSMNGQTGKIVGELPVSVGKIALWFSGITGVVFLIMFLMMNLFGL